MNICSHTLLYNKHLQAAIWPSNLAEQLFYSFLLMTLVWEFSEARAECDWAAVLLGITDDLCVKKVIHWQIKCIFALYKSHIAYIYFFVYSGRFMRWYRWVSSQTLGCLTVSCSLLADQDAFPTEPFRTFHVFPFRSLWLLFFFLKKPAA